MQILLVGSENRQSDTLSTFLRKYNYPTDVVDSDICVQKSADIEVYDLIIIYRIVGKKNELSVLEALKEKGVHALIIIILTDDRVDNRIKALEYGADDYLTQPFSFDELLAKLRAFERRINQPDIRNETFYLSSLTFVPSKGRVNYGDKSLKLTPRESKLFELLIRNKNQVITKEQLFEKIWGLTSDVEINSIDVYLSFLRKKLKQLHCPVVIENVRGVGYYLKEEKADMY